MKKIYQIAIVCCALLVAVGIVAVGKSRTQVVNHVSLAVGSTAPDFIVKTIDGQSFSLASHKGKPVIIFAMFGGCGECIPVGQTLVQIQKDYAAQGVSVVAIDILEGEPTTTLAQYGTFVKANFPLASYDSTVVSTYKLTAPEITYVIDKNGIIVDINKNALNYEQYKEELDKII